jgi:hypothetical protein
MLVRWRQSGTTTDERHHTPAVGRDCPSPGSANPTLGNIDGSRLQAKPAVLGLIEADQGEAGAGH